MNADREDKPAWSAVPPEVRRAVDRVLGVPVARAVRAYGGCGPSATAELAVRSSAVTLKPQLKAVVEVIKSALEADLEALYLYGSAVAGGLQPASDLDLLAVTCRRTTPAQRRRLIDGLRPLSARDARPTSWRPVELSVVVRMDIVPWRYPPRMDFMSGEWLRASFDAGKPTPMDWANPDLAVLIAQIQQFGSPLVGPPASEVLPAIPPADLVRAMVDEIDTLRGDLETDTANVLLTLARIWCTLETRTFAPKNVAADWALARLPDNTGVVLARARDVYLGTAPGTWLEQGAWTDAMPAARLAADSLVENIELACAVATIHER